MRAKYCKIYKGTSFYVASKNSSDIDDSKCTYLRVCSLHFVTGKPSALTDQTNPDWAPSQNLGHTYVEKVDVDRYARISERNEKRKRSESIETVLSAVTQSTLTTHLVDEEHGATSASLSESESNNKYSQTELSLDKITAMKIEINRLTQENLELKNKISDMTIDEKSFLNDDEKVLFYTGLPSWKILSATLELVRPYLMHSPKCSLSPFRELLLTVMKLRLNLTGEDLAYRFGNINKGTVLRIFLQVIDVLYNHLSPLILWPDREALRKTLPVDFRKHCPKCVAIIDFFEIFLDRALNLLARAQTYSSYKHHNMIKYLIAISPQGTISFISSG
ncbi:uncharacterized protein LOC124454191 [Xenia sp. Carnegie-2017]|uniref:uncharacterized protein LOC124454191 n=1 Tax=Xenia sp. Carnegie-2017 TaxID=2897299 RepID=UPI001F0370DB|nr:uncharacterized protein LOC124454191 [Xenia sp. Carnegie-2017]